MSEPQRFAFRYGVMRPLLSALGLGPTFSAMELDDNELRVRFSWAFAARIARSSIVSADHDSGFVTGIGVHGWKGTWLVNGAGSGLVAIDIDPPVRALVTGFPVKLRRLRVSAANPEQLVAALRRR
jgi:hypothetical protein